MEDGYGNNHKGGLYMEENFQIIQPALIAETLMHNAEIIKQFIA